MSTYMLNVLNTYTGADRNCYVGARHLREVLHRLENKYGSSRHYSGSRQDDYAMARHINETFTRAEVSEIHYKVAEELPKKGRPRWATNKQSADAVQTSSIATELVEMRRQVAAAQAAANMAIATPHHAPPVPNGHSYAEDYVTCEEFNEHEQAQTEAFSKVRDDINHVRGQFVALTVAIQSIEAAKPTIVQVQPINAPAIDLGLQHYRLPLLIKAVQARKAGNKPLNFWLYGPAGTGKSMGAAAVAKAFGLEYAENGKMLDKTEIEGYRDGYGVYHSTQFRDAYENGKLYCGDEIDGWSDEATLAMNNALASGRYAFKDKTVTRHPNFIFIGTANTVGKGGTVEYGSRFQHDAAFLDRFAFVEWPHDNSLEDACCDNKDWLARVRHVRARLARSDVRNHLVTMRASIDGAALLAVGISQTEVEEMTLRKGLSDDLWAKIN